MPFRELKVAPTRVNDECIHGPRAYYDRVSEAVAMALGIQSLPDKRLNATSREPGILVRRLRDGCLNITVEPHAHILRTQAFFDFMKSALALAPADVDPYPIYPVALPAVEPPMNGVSLRWQFNLAERRFVVPSTVAPLVRALDPHAISEMSEEEFYMGIDEPDRVRDAFEAAIAGVALLDVEYRRHGAPVRITGAVVRDAIGNPLRIIGISAKPLGQRTLA